MIRKVFALIVVCLSVTTLLSSSAFGANTKSSPFSGLICIHRYEGAWNANTGNGYYGGLQMDKGFMQTYGSEFLSAWGTADKWPPTVQLVVAMRAVLSGRGYGPWPHTRIPCRV